MSDRQNEMDRIREAAEAGDAEAQTALGTALAAGSGGERDQEEALVWLRKAAASGEITAMFNLGIMHEKGLGTPVDGDEAALWYWQAAELGDTGSKRKLGTMILREQGFSPESPVVRAIKASAQAENPFALSFLAKLHLDGIGMARDDTYAEELFRMAAELGEESAIYNLGEMKMEGRTGLTSEDEIADWFFGLGRVNLAKGDLVKAFDCLVSIKRINSGHFLAQRLEEEIEKANESRMKQD